MCITNIKREERSHHGNNIGFIPGRLFVKSEVLNAESLCCVLEVSIPAARGL